MSSNLIEALSHATTDTGAASVASLSLIQFALSLVIGDEYLGGRIKGLITPAFFYYLAHQKGFAECLAGKNMHYENQYFSFAGVDWFVHGGLPGVGTTHEHCYMFRESAIENSQSAAYTENVFTIRDQSGVVRVYHDGSCFV